MANNEVILNEEYFTKMKSYYNKTGELLDLILREYIQILFQIREKGIVEGETAKALSVYIMSVGILKGQNAHMSKEIADLLQSYITAVDREDKFLY